MKRLKSKVFYVLILILTLFLITILFIFNIQSYSRERNNAENNLIRMVNPIKEARKDKEFQINIEGIDLPNTENIEKKIFMDSVIYTIRFDKAGNIIEIITHTENGIVNNEIKDIAQDIIKSQNRKQFKIGNLYADKYSYAFKEGNQLIIADNGQVSQRLKNELKTSIILFVLLEIIIIYVSRKLTNWIIKPANEAMEKQTRFITDASHELKTPVAVIMASAEALQNDYKQKWIDNIKNESDRMNELITSLLDLSKIENSKDKELFVDVDLSKLIQKSCLTFESLMFEKNITFTSNIDENVLLKCEEYQIKQLISIIMDNAIRHSEQKGEIIVNLKNHRTEIILEIKNKGKAIPKEMEEKIFERFYRADESRNRNENRYGLGLAIAKGIVEKHNGNITAHSENGYTTFRINLKK